MKSLPFLCTFFLFFCPLSSAVQITTHEENNAFTPVSITRYAHDSYITADYKHLYSLTKDRDIWFLKLLPIIDPQNLVPESNRTNGHFGIAVAGNYNPTGVYYSNKHNRLYIANYTGHNILVAQISSNPFVATITKNILHPDLKSPENVFVDDKRDLMAVADYDNSSILLFDLNGQLKWKQSLGLAHGVLIDGDFVYATGLSNIPLAKLDLKNGSIIKENKLIGVEKGELLYATQVVKVPNQNNVAVINTNSGRVVTYNSDLEFISEFGSMGPQPDQFYRPYGLYFDADKILIADTQKNRIVILSPDLQTMNVVGIDMPTFVGKYLKYGNVNPYCSHEKSPDFILSLLKDAYSLPDEIDIFNGYQTLCLLKNNRQFSVALLPWMSETYQSTKRMYIPLQYIWSKEFKVGNRQIAVFGSPGQNSLLVIDSLTSTLHKAELPRGVQIWGPDESVFFNYIETLALAEVEKFDQQVRKCNGNILATYLTTSSIYPKASLDEALTGLFYSEQKKALYQSWKNNLPVKNFFSNWAKEGGKIIIEDALLLKLVSENTYQKTLEDYSFCTNTLRG